MVFVVTGNQYLVFIFIFLKYPIKIDLGVFYSPLLEYSPLSRFSIPAAPQAKVAVDLPVSVLPRDLSSAGIYSTV